MPDLHQPAGAADDPTNSERPEPSAEGVEPPKPSVFAKPNDRTGQAPDDEDDLN